MSLRRDTKETERERHLEKRQGEKDTKRRDRDQNQSNHHLIPLLDMCTTAHASTSYNTRLLQISMNSISHSSPTERQILSQGGGGA